MQGRSRMARRVFSGNGLGGLLVVAIGFFFYIYGNHLQFYEENTIGAGYMPMSLTTILVVLGMIICLQTIFSSSERNVFYPRIDWRSFFIIISALALFSLLISFFGLLPGVFFTVLYASLAAGPLRWVAFWAAIAMTVIIWFVFGFGLGLTIPMLKNGVGF